MSKALILYSSNSGNTEKVAVRFKETFEKHGWEVTLFKAEKKEEHVLNPPFDPQEYDVLCAGSGLRAHLPYNELLNVLRHFRVGGDPRFVLRARDETIPYITAPMPAQAPWSKEGLERHHRKIILGPDAKKAIIFATYGGYEFGPWEAQPAMDYMALEVAHFGFLTIGTFSCPGKFVDAPMEQTFHGDIRQRPDERDLLRAELFIEDKLEEMADRGPLVDRRG
jgi:hypothetical protein